MENDFLTFFGEFLKEFFNEILLFINSLLKEYSFYFWLVKIMSFILIFLFLFGIIYYFRKLKIFSKWQQKWLNWFALSPDYFWQKRCWKSWKEIENLFSEPYESSWKLAILKSANLLKKTLPLIDYPDDFFEALSRLKKEGYQNLEIIEEFYKKAEEIANNPKVKVDQEESKKMVKIFKKFFIDLLASIS